MILVNEVAFSEEAWGWLNERIRHAKEFADSNDTIKPEFRPYLNDKKIMHGTGRKDEYQELTAGEMWEFFYNVFCLMTNVLKPGTFPPLSTSVTTDELKDELEKIERCMVYWSLMKGFKENEELKGLRKEYLSIERNSTNMLFCMYVYCMMNAMWEKFEKLKEILHGREPKFMQNRSKKASSEIYKYNEYRFNEEAGDEFMRAVIRECCGGDFNDFIISVKSRIAEESLGEFHVELAKLKGYELMSQREFPDVEKREAWRRIFTTYFDEEETNFPLFYQTFTRQCYDYMMLSFLSISNMGSVSYIPIYDIYSDNNFEESYERSIKPMINTKLIRGKLLSLYNKRI